MSDVVNGSEIKGVGGYRGAGWAYQQLQLMRQAKYDLKHGRKRKSLITLALERVKEEEAKAKALAAPGETGTR